MIFLNCQKLFELILKGLAICINSELYDIYFSIISVYLKIEHFAFPCLYNEQLIMYHYVFVFRIFVIKFIYMYYMSINVAICVLFHF